MKDTEEHRAVSGTDFSLSIFGWGDQMEPQYFSNGPT